MREVVNKNGVLDEIDVHEKALSESKCDVMMDLSGLEKEKVTIDNKLYVESEEVAQLCDEEVVEEVTQMLWAILDNNKKVRVKIRVYEELSILTIQRFVRVKKLYESMIKKLGGTRGKISPKLSSTIICKIFDVTIRHKDVITLRGNHFITI